MKRPKPSLTRAVWAPLFLDRTPSSRPLSPDLRPLLLVLALGALLRLFRLDGQSLWYDEGVSAFMTNRGPLEIATAAAADIHPPLYYWLLAAWAVAFGNGELSLRGLSVLLGTATIWVVWRLAAELYGKSVALVAAGLLAVSPLAVHYGQEVRMYALAGLLAAASTWAYVRVIRTAGRAGPALVYGLLAAALLYTHYYGVLVLAAHQIHLVVALAATRRWHLVQPWILGTAVGAVLYVPWLPHALRQTGYYPGLGTPQSPPALTLDALNVLSLGVATTRFSFRPALAPFVALACLGLSARRRPELAKPGVAHSTPVPGALLLLWLVLPTSVIIALSTSRPLYEPRFLMLVLPAWLILVGAGVMTLSRLAADRLQSFDALSTLSSVAGAVVAAATMGLLLIPTARSLGAYYFDPAYARDDYRTLARQIEAAERPGDAVVLTAPGQAEVFGYYYRGHSPLFPLPAQRPIEPGDTRARLEALASVHPRIWLVRWAAREADPEDLIGRWLETHGRLAGTQLFGTVELRLYDLAAIARRCQSLSA